MRSHRTLPHQMVLMPVIVLAMLVGAIDPALQHARANSRALPDLVETGATPPDPVELALLPGGPSDDAVIALVGQSVVWHNDSPSAVALTSDSGVIDSGPIPPGGAYAATFPGAGIIDYQTDSGHPGKVIVGATIPGDADSLVLGGLPDLGFPLLDPADAGVHPTLALKASRTRIMLGFTPPTTVAQANDVLTRVGTPLVGTLPTSDILLVLAEDTADFSGMDAALAALRAEPTVEFAAMDPLPQADTIPVDPDSSVVGPKYGWDEPTTVPDAGDGSNWHLEAVRAPQAWNLTEALEADARGIQAAVIDTGFKADHPDLQGRLEVFEPCFPSTFFENCAENDPESTNAPEHGTHVAGIISASWGTDSEGTRGINPIAPVIGLSWAHQSGSALFSALFDAIEDGTYPGVRALNLSAGFGTDAATWARAHRSFTCGPGPADDLGGTGPCLPTTEDGSLVATMHIAAEWRHIAARASSLGVLISTSAGNDSTMFCNSGGSLAVNLVDTPPGSSTCPWIPQDSAGNSALNWLSRTWNTADGTNPILVVESLGNLTPPATPGDIPSLVPSFERSYFSQTGGDIAAPGLILSTCVTDRVCFLGGTSQAAPMVAGVAALLAAHSSAPDLATRRSAIKTWSHNNNPPGPCLPWPACTVTNSVDAFWSLVSLDGAAADLVDVNDTSHDGNQRTVRDAANTVTSDYTVVDPGHPDRFTAPDGRVDMRDFRRYRDAWLQGCLAAPTAGCPAAGDIALDGAPDHPKKDLDQNGCVTEHPVPGITLCPPEESIFARFDFNGDGKLTRTDTTPMPFDAAGTLVTGPTSAVPLTDLQVLAGQWSAVPGQWLSNDLEMLMTSGDLEVHADGLFAAGATAGRVTAVDTVTDTDLTTEVFDPTAPSLALTVPASTDVTLRVDYTLPGGEQSTLLPTPTLRSGEDHRIDVCGAIKVTANPTSIEPDGTATLTMELDPCAAVPLDGYGVAVTIVPDGTDAGVSDDTPLTDTAGVATTTFLAGSTEGNYTVTASAQVDDGAGGVVTLTGEGHITVDGDYVKDVIAETGTGFTALGSGPSINDDGDVAFVASSSGDAGVYAAPDGASPVRLSAPLDGSRNEGVYGQVEVTDQDRVFALIEWVHPDTGSRRRLMTFDFPTPFNPTVVARSHLRYLGGPPTDPDADFASMGLPATNDVGGFVVPVLPLGVSSGVGNLATPDGAGGFLLGQALASFGNLDASYSSLADHADDGSTVLTGDYWNGELDPRGLPIFDRSVFAGDAVINSAQTIATASEGWPELGVSATSDDAQVIAFGADRGDGDGLFLSWLGSSGFTDPIPLLGENASSPGAELGTDSGGSPLYLTDIDLQEPLEVIHRESGAPGLADDTAVVVFLATPNAASDHFSDQPGLWSVIVHLAGTGDVDTPIVAVPETPVAVAQLGDPMGTETVTSIGIHDPLGDGTGTGIDDHQVVYRLASASTQQIVRATWEGPLDLPLGATPLANPAAFARTMRSAVQAIANRMTAAATTPTPVAVPAFTIADTTPNEDTDVTVTNRSRWTDGSPMAAEFDPGDGSTGGTFSADGSAQWVWTDPGPVTTSMSVEAGAISTAIDLDIQDVPNRAPVADAGGPYAIGLTQGLTLDGAGSSDPDAGDTLTYEWDLDGNGSFGEATGETVELTWAQVETGVCGGTCVTGVPYIIGLRVIDAEGMDDTDSTQVEFAGQGDFTISLGPATQLVNPGSSARFLVGVSPLEGFDGEVTLTTGSLPAGWSAYFSPEKITPGSPSEMTISAPSDAPDAPVSFTVVGTSGDLVHETTGEASVSFALVPECFGDARITVIDADTGLPLEGVDMVVSPYSSSSHEGQTDANGIFAASDLGTFPGNTFTLLARLDGYAPSSGPAYSYPIVCETVTEVTVELLPRLFGTVEGRVVEGTVDALGRVTPTDTPIEGAALDQINVSTDADGRYRNDAVEITRDINGTHFAFGASKRGSADDPGYWDAPGQGVKLTETETYAERNFALVPQCTITVGFTGRVVDQDGNPVAGAHVAWGDVPLPTTSADGTFATIQKERLLGYNNSAIKISVYSGPPSDWPAGSYGSERQDFTAAGCGNTIVPDVELVVTRGEGPSFASVEGVVRDEVTLEPIPGAAVQLKDSGGNTKGYMTAAADGSYRFDEVYLGVGPDAIKTNWYVVATQIGVPVSVYHRGLSPRFDLTPDEVQQADVGLRRIRFAAIEGRVTDRSTGDPIPDATVWVNCRTNCAWGGYDATTDADGFYRIEGMALNADDDPAGVDVVASPPRSDGERPEWFEDETTATLHPEQTATADLSLIPVCAGATITGVVVSAATLEPIEGATVQAAGWAPGYDLDQKESITGPNGVFTLTDLVPGYLNKPNLIGVYASAPGFIPQMKFVTVFCGGTIRLNFGEPSGGSSAVVGTVTEMGTGDPIADVFIGSSFGGSDTTDSNGDYRLDDAPLGSDGSAREWEVTAIHPDGREQRANVTVLPDSEVRQDYQFAASPPTSSTTSTTSTTTSTSTTSTTSTTTTSTTTTSTSTTSTTSTTTTSTTTSTTSTTTTSTSTTSTTAPSTTSTSTTSTTAPSTTSTSTTSTTAPSTTSTSTPSTETTVPVVAPDATSTPSDPPAASVEAKQDARSGGASLPVTGASVAALLLTGLALIGSGSMTAAWARRRKHHRQGD